MKIIVDKIPSTPNDCLFVERNCKYGWVCSLHNPTPYKYDDEGICNPTKCSKLQEERNGVK